MEGCSRSRKAAPPLVFILVQDLQVLRVNAEREAAEVLAVVVVGQRLAFDLFAGKTMGAYGATLLVPPEGAIELLITLPPAPRSVPEPTAVR